MCRVAVDKRVPVPLKKRVNREVPNKYYLVVVSKTVYRVGEAYLEQTPLKRLQGYYEPFNGSYASRDIAPLPGTYRNLTNLTAETASPNLIPHP